MNNLIELEHVTKKYANKGILEEISLSIKEGECIGILGNNGVGKRLIQLIS
ncbi:ATP-binding cassette domain-containing protein [Oceanobacillus piezotolerans]|uniref:ATP-binding cassette domain-containing protein n=1 Tax=Oceanobacillus piezotolerans TaxID=2448030 RepID=A0A498DDH3_9BACI|nr:ATP-binding cassette domain-containing protein [Oceanobacillus piezotolerans]RLL48262.1 ATP-binding cassette domain-containing protein [Oceanobacillus piezotolerans]